MAKGTKPQTKANQTNEADDLLGDETPAAQTPGTDETATPPSEDQLIEFEGEQLTQAQIDEKIKAAQAILKNLKAAKKGDKAKTERTLKGQMVAFKNKKGDVITGLGVLYYVTRHGGKLHYKESSQVVVLPEGWKEGDALPELPGGEEEAAAS